jgi:two-component system response regulator RegA
MTEKEKPAALVVDDDEVYRARLCRSFGLRGWEAQGAADIGSALAMAREMAPDLAVVDLRLANESGLSLIPSLRESDPTMTIVMLTGYGSVATALEAGRLGADRYLSKPVDVDQILAAYEVARDPAMASAPPPSTVPSLARVEWEHIQRVMADCGGNVSQAARLLGLHRRSLQRKLGKNPTAI